MICNDKYFKRRGIIWLWDNELIYLDYSTALLVRLSFVDLYLGILSTHPEIHELSYQCWFFNIGLYLLAGIILVTLKKIRFKFNFKHQITIMNISTSFPECPFNVE
jgi:hypothetical protein